MKLFSEYPLASISLTGGEGLRDALLSLAERDPPSHVLETGTYTGQGSTTLIAATLARVSPPTAFVTIESRWSSWRQARINLASFSFVRCVWGYSVALKAMIEFLAQDDALQNHEEWSDIFIDNVDDPAAFYREELQADLRVPARDRVRRRWDQLWYYDGQDLLRSWLVRFRNERPLLVLDSAGGIGFLEFQVVWRTMGSHPYLLLLDDIHHLKHFRSLAHILADPGFRVIAIDQRHGWVLAEHLEGSDNQVVVGT